ncbi:MAG: LPS export ABC transporter ATP-binding protein [Gammaproteobacteria bacterium]
MDLTEPHQSESAFMHTECLRKRYGAIEAVRDVSMSVNRGEIVGLVGPNGAGKTTAFYMITGLIRPDGGSIYVDKGSGLLTDVTYMPIYKRVRMGFGYLSQEPSVFRSLSVAENIQVALEQKELSRIQQRERLDELLNQYNLWDIRGHLGSVLSGGQRRRTEIARILATEPSLLLMDEPFASIDPVSVEKVKEAMLELKKDGLGIIVTDHSVRDIFDISDRTYIMLRGQVIASGDADFLINHPLVRKEYLGNKFRL